MNLYIYIYIYIYILSIILYKINDKLIYVYINYNNRVINSIKIK